MSKNYKQKSRNFNSKGKRTNTKGRRANESDEFDTDSKRTRSSNDPSWYAADPVLMRTSSNIGFNWAAGNEIDLHYPTNNSNIEVPTIMTYDIIPSVGFTADESDPINVASKAVYAYVRYQRSGSHTYDHVDLMIYLLGMSQVYSYINYLIRAYGSARLFTHRNRSFPDLILKSMGVDPDDLRLNMASLKFGIELLINEAARFAVPADMSYFRRQAFMYENIYVEGTSLKDQIYMYVPAKFMRYTTDTDGAGMLEYVDFFTDKSKLHTVQELLDFGFDMLKRIINWQDSGIMTSDILHAYGEGGIITLNKLNEDYVIAPIYDLGVLEQMKNATALGLVDTDFGVRQDNTKGFLQSYLYVYSYGDHDNITDYRAASYTELLKNWMADRLITTVSYEATPELVIENTRLTAGVTTKSMKMHSAIGNVTHNYWRYGIICGSEVVGSVYVWSMDPDAGTRICDRVDSQMVIFSGNADFEVDMLKRISLLSNFKFHPCVDIWLVSEAAAIKHGGLIFDVDNYGIITADELDMMHTAALINEFDVPLLAKVR